ncbi:hypothetical protein [Allobranchiibius sp. GilTou73]|uniref:TolB family protein n=1 Tax=Allobranchiibius sp. GilTou73 TaxID=2904523 RepID=UPI001F2F59BD|nr:hypothetical protein [Allobranchiibius sp. GilTou73]UIJ35999.1 hypothetical protein LVQ62_06385 [Allobranchiibius sp. GilTou73]
MHASPLDPSDTFVTTINDPARGGQVQIRGIDDGGLLITSAHSRAATTVSATRERSGPLIVALTTGCRATVERVDPETGRVTVLDHLTEDVAGITVSPDGSRLAYLTHPRCVVSTCKSICAGPEIFNPSVIVVLDLATGRGTRTATDTPGHPLFGLSWSPNGHQIAAGYSGNRDQVVTFDSTKLDFATARRVPDPSEHGYLAPAWTTSGIVAAQESGAGMLSPSRLVRMNVDGHVSASWTLPSCVDGLITATNPTRTRVLVQSDIGYGNGSCSKKWTTQLSTTLGIRLRTILETSSAVQLSS